MTHDVKVEYYTYKHGEKTLHGTVDGHSFTAYYWFSSHGSAKGSWSASISDLPAYAVLKSMRIAIGRACTKYDALPMAQKTKKEIAQ
jgi:hypothetical protein